MDTGMDTGIGLRRGAVAVEPHRREWEAAAGQAVALLREILGDAAADVQHVGSTAVPGICAKPIIDIAVGARDMQRIRDKDTALEEKGFRFRGQDHPGQWLYVCGEGDIRTHHIHVTAYGGEAWNHYLGLRDWLRGHEDDARAYSELKMSLARRYPEDRAAYTAMKSGFIEELLRKADAWRGTARPEGAARPEGTGPA